MLTILLLQIYKTSILPLLEHANFTSSLILKNLAAKKQRLQNRTLRIIFAHEPSLTREELHVKANLTSIKQRADKQILCIMYEKSLKPTQYPQIESEGITRSSDKIKFKLPLPKNERFRHYPHYHGAKLWDFYPTKRNIPSI